MGSQELGRGRFRYCRHPGRGFKQVDVHTSLKSKSSIEDGV